MRALIMSFRIADGLSTVAVVLAVLGLGGRRLWHRRPWRRVLPVPRRGGGRR